MSAVPQGAFAALKVKENCRKPSGGEFSSSEGEQNFASFNRNDTALLQPPLKYNSKLMNSVWGLYNRYSVHNLKNNSDSITFNVLNNQIFQA